MRMLIISFHFPPCTDGAATLMHNLCKYLPRDSYSVITVSDEFGKPAFHMSGAYDKEFGFDCDVTRLPVRTNGLRDRTKFLFLGILKGLYLMRKKSADSIVAVYPDEFDLFIAYVLYFVTRKPLVVYMHDLYSEVRKDARLYRIWRSFESRILSRASTVIVTNEKFRDYYLGKGIRNVTIVHSCVDLDAYKCGSSTKQQEHQTKKLRIAYTGSVYGANDDPVVCFLKAARKMSKNVEVVFSTPNERDYLKEVSVGFLSKRECLELQRSADVLFLPLSFKSYLREEIEVAFPCKILEYLAVGKPVLAIVPEGSFVQDLLKKSGAGLVITELSEEEIFEAINILRNEEQRSDFSANALKTAVFFDARIQSEKLCSIVRKVISKAGSAS